MLYSSVTFYHQVVKPTLCSLHINNPVLARILTAIAVCPESSGTGGIGVYQITHQQHRQLWDGYLAHRPELASRVRGLASQHRFLSDPELELALNPGYATAVAVYLIAQHGLSLSTATAEQLIERWSTLNSVLSRVISNRYRHLCDLLVRPATETQCLFTVAGSHDTNRAEFITRKRPA